MAPEERLQFQSENKGIIHLKSGLILKVSFYW
jgi:hypothetical protein